jgi:hypothetical protein
MIVFWILGEATLSNLLQVMMKEKLEIMVGCRRYRACAGLLGVLDPFREIRSIRRVYGIR